MQQDTNDMMSNHVKPPLNAWGNNGWEIDILVMQQNIVTEQD